MEEDIQKYLLTVKSRGTPHVSKGSVYHWLQFNTVKPIFKRTTEELV